MSNYSAEDPEGRATAIAAERRDEIRDEEAAGEVRGAPSDASGVDDIADEDVVVLNGDRAGSGDLPGSSADGPRSAEASGYPPPVQAEPPLTTTPVTGQAEQGLPAGGTGNLGPPAVAEPASGLAQLQERWLAIQSDFVDDPRRSVNAAAELVTEAIGLLVAEIRDREASLRGTWDTADADTEVLRTALREYRSFLDRLVAL
jgi:hypothetical protein